MSRITTDQIAELLAQDKDGRITRGNFQKFLLNPDGGTFPLINTDAPLFIPSGWQVEEHKRDRQFLFDPTKVGLFHSPKQKNGKVISGHDLRQELKDKPVLNACVLDYLLAHPEPIPESWKGKYIYFWGTIYRRADGDLYVRFLYWDDGRWDWNYFWLGYGWSGHGPAAVASV
ncbi:MAG: hypothetical protein NTU97_03805 [Candidatus Magasanikbacteria bacterium]|nr:hypothetical protein [Candidatus Magasanikbacteria bacterium]